MINLGKTLFGLPAGEEFPPICPSFGFIVSSNLTGTHSIFTPLLIDVDAHTLNVR